MSEKDFQEIVVKWCDELINNYIEKNKLKCGAERLIVSSKKVISGWQPWSWEQNPDKWHWMQFKRETDVLIGLNASIDSENLVIPLVALELKSGKFLNTDELDKKSAVYGGLRELYPWIYTIFLHEDISDRAMNEAHLLRNSRQFDSIFTSWDKESQELISRVITFKIDYLLKYWKM
jgi:hypothetical protein